MTIVSFLLALSALLVAILALSVAQQASGRTDDNLRYLSDLRTRTGNDSKELFRELNRIKVKLLKSAGNLDYMPYEITDACICCGACENECPEGAIKPGEIYRINPETCTACGTCAEVCPVSACVEMKLD